MSSFLPEVHLCDRQFLQEHSRWTCLLWHGCFHLVGCLSNRTGIQFCSIITLESRRRWRICLMQSAFTHQAQGRLCFLWPLRTTIQPPYCFAAALTLLQIGSHTPYLHCIFLSLLDGPRRGSLLRHTPHPLLVFLLHLTLQRVTSASNLCLNHVWWPTSFFCRTEEFSISTAPKWVRHDFICFVDLCYLLTPGTAGYGNDSWAIGHSYAEIPVLKPAIYDPEASKGQRWSSDGLSASTVPRMYHSAAILLPDGEDG